MKVCPRCESEYEDRFVYCYKCGCHLKDKDKFCPFCGSTIETDGEFCPFCGEKINIQVSMTSIRRKKKADFFSYENFFSYEGRSGRLNFFFADFLLVVIFSIITSLFLGYSLYKYLWLYFIFLILIMYSYFCIVNRRFHDLDKSAGWSIFYLIVSFFPMLFILMGTVNINLSSYRSIFNFVVAFNLLSKILGFIICIYLMFFRGTDGANQYGEEPPII